MILHCTVKSPLGRPKHFTSHPLPLADLFILTCTPAQLLWEAFVHAAVNLRTLSPTLPPPSIARYSFMPLSELGHRGEKKRQALEAVSKMILTWALSIESPAFYHTAIVLLIDDVPQILRLLK